LAIGETFEIGLALGGSADGKCLADEGVIGVGHTEKGAWNGHRCEWYHRQRMFLLGRWLRVSPTEDVCIGVSSVVGQGVSRCSDG